MKNIETKDDLNSLLDFIDLWHRLPPHMRLYFSLRIRVTIFWIAFRRKFPSLALLAALGALLASIP